MTSLDRRLKLSEIVGMWFIVLSVTCLAGTMTALPCEEARLKCAYRVGCGNALQNYLLGCSAVLQGPYPSYCPEICQNSLIALVSTDEGRQLMDCDCRDQYCEDQKERSEVCRPQVMRAMSQPILPCRVAQWICAADALCSKAFEYYNQFCKAMFHGKKCTSRCSNSINILRKQEKAAKLTTCKCDGSEDYDCHAIRRNMDKLCFNKHARHHTNKTHQSNKTHYAVVPTVDLDGSGTAVVGSWIVLFSIVAALVT